MVQSPLEGWKPCRRESSEQQSHIYALVHSTRLQTDSSLPLTDTSWAWQGLVNPAALPLSLFLPSMKPVERSPGSQVSFEVTAWLRCNARETGKFSPWPKASQSALCILLGHCCSVPSTPASSASPSLSKCEAPASRPSLAGVSVLNASSITCVPESVPSYRWPNATSYAMQP